MVNIREVIKEDLETLGEIFVEVYTVFDVGERWEKESAVKLMEYWFNKQPDLAYLVEFEDRIVGAFFTAIKPWWDGNRLFDGEFFIHPEFQNKKIGKKLFKKVLEEAVEKYDVKIFDAFTFNGPDFPLSWYKKLGFKEIKEWTMFSGNVQEVLKNLS